MGGQDQIQLIAHAAAGIRQIHWFANRRYLGASAPAEPLTWLTAAGDYELQAMNDEGRIASRQVALG